MNYDTALDDENVKYFKLLKDKLLFLFLLKKYDYYTIISLLPNHSLHYMTLYIFRDNQRMVENVENEIQIEATGPDFVVR